MERQVAACHIAGALAGIRCSARDTEVIGIKTGAISRTDLKINRTQASDFFIIWVYLYHTTTQMRYLLFVVIGLIGCFPLRAQTPEDNLRDEEYYPFQNGYEEPYSPMIDTDSSLFYRAIQSTGDLFRDATDFKFSFVAYNRRGEPYRPDRMSLNGIRLPSRYIPSMNALYPQKYGEPMNGWHLPTTLDAEYRTSEEPLLPERNAALQFSGRNYLMGLRLTIAENLGRNWDLAATVQGRTGRDLYADGVFSNSLNAAILLSKRFGDRHLFSLLTVVPVSMRSLRTSSTREAFDLTGNPLYNPSWGYQDGKVRSGRIRREAVPLAAAAYRIRLTDATSLAATFTAETGIRRYSSLAWYDAPSPMPDYYRWMPGYQTDPVTRLEMENIWRANDVRYTQIDWDEFYRQNRNSKDGSATYLMEDRVERIANMQLLAEGITRISERLTVRYGIRAARTDSRFYKQMRDLMGRSYFVDRDYYLIDDGVYGNKLQNDLRHPDRIIREGDRFGYDYDLRRNEIGAGGSLEYRADRLRAFIAAEVGAASVFRRGHYEKELFAGNKSFGKSRALHFAPYLFRASAGYSFSVRHHLEMTVRGRTELHLVRAQRALSGYALRRPHCGRHAGTALLRRFLRNIQRHGGRRHRNAPLRRGSDRPDPAGIPLEPHAGSQRRTLPLCGQSRRHGLCRREQRGVGPQRHELHGRLLGRQHAPTDGFRGTQLLRSERLGRTGGGRMDRESVRRTVAGTTHVAHRPATGRIAGSLRTVYPPGTARGCVYVECHAFQIVLFQRLASDSDALGAQPSQRQRPTLQRLRISPCTPHPDRRHVCLPTAGHPLSVCVSPDLLRLHILQILISVRFFRK